VLLHAASGSGAFWDYQLPALARAGYRAIGYSRRGHGASRAGDATDPGVASEDLKNLTAFLGIERFHAVGVAAGGVYAADFALSYPEHLHTLALVASTIGVTDAAYVALGAAIRPPAFANLPIEFQELGPSYRAGNPDGVAAWLAREAGNPYTSGRMVFPKTTHAMTWADVETIAVPVLLLGGDADLWVPPAVLRLQASHLPHAEVHVVAEAGHHPYWEQPDEFNRLLLAFLGNRSDGTESRTVTE
jgi:pimeloyl-ACP methyl ester carboxylesterase